MQARLGIIKRHLDPENEVKVDCDENYEIFTFVDRRMERMMGKWGIREKFGRLASKANEMIKEYFEYHLNQKISRLFRNSEFN